MNQQSSRVICLKIGINKIHFHQSFCFSFQSKEENTCVQQFILRINHSNACENKYC